MALLLLTASAAAGEALWVTEGNRLRRYALAELDGDSPSGEVVVEAVRGAGDVAPPATGDAATRRRDVNGMICFLPDGSGRFAMGEDTGQPGRTPGWGIFGPDGVQQGKLTPTYRMENGEPYGCAFDAAGRLFTTSVGNKGFGRSKGQLVLWFPPFGDGAKYCKIATDIGTAAGIVVDRRGRVYVASSSRGVIHRFSPPFPSGPDAARGCAQRDETGAPLATEVRRSVFARGLYTFSGLALGEREHLYAASVFTGEIVELDHLGRVVRRVLDPPGFLPPFETGSPFGLARDADGALYYTDLDLQWDGLAVDAGDAGKLWRIRFDADGAPQPPELLLEGLAFPDGVAIEPGH